LTTPADGASREGGMGGDHTIAYQRGRHFHFCGPVTGVVFFAFSNHRPDLLKKNSQSLIPQGKRGSGHPYLAGTPWESATHPTQCFDREKNAPDGIQVRGRKLPQILLVWLTMQLLPNGGVTSTFWENAGGGGKTFRVIFLSINTPNLFFPAAELFVGLLASSVPFPFAFALPLFS